MKTNTIHAHSTPSNAYIHTYSSDVSLDARAGPKFNSSLFWVKINWVHIKIDIHKKIWYINCNK